MYRTPLGVNVDSLTTKLIGALASGSVGTESRETAAELYRVLIAPFVSKLPQQSRLVIVPDKWLHFVPFAALRDSASHRFLVQQFETIVAPSMQLYFESTARYDSLQRSPPREILAVGDPAFDTRAFSLARLPGAEREARRAASFYKSANVLIGSQATKRAFLRGAAGSNVIHFAGHGVVRSDAPLLSYLVLASDSGSDGALTAKALFEETLPLTRLAILSGCETASGRLSDTEGVSSLARAFFAAGVPAIIASMWAVDDEATAEFFADFHAGLSNGEDPSGALRRTQLASVAKKGWSGASTWAAFTLFGGTTGRAPDGRSTEH
jgi:CHAT domain-containing protein